MVAKALAKLIVATGAVLPTQTVRWLARKIGRAVYWVPAAREGLLLNARHILGERSSHQQRRDLAHGVLDSFALALTDLVLAGRLWKADIGENEDSISSPVTDKFEVVQYENLERATRSANGSGFVTVTLHMGSYEAGCMLLARKRSPVTIVYHRDPAGFFEELRSRQRHRFPVEEIAIDSSPFFAVDLLQRLKSGGTVLLAGELAAQLHGEPFPFLDGTAHFSLWPARLAVTAGVPILPAFMVRARDNSLRIHLETPIECHEGDDPRAVMENLVPVFEDYVRRYPDQWLMVRSFWDESVETSNHGFRMNTQ